MTNDQSTRKLPSAPVLQRFADDRDYRMMDPMIGPAVDLYAGLPFAATVAACPGNDDWKKKTPAGVIIIDLNEDEQ
jgi:hypothetical protein